MKKLPTFSLKRTVAGVTTLAVLLGLFMSAINVFIATKQASAQQATDSTVFSWVNAGTIVSNGATYFNTDITSSSDWKNTAAGDCTYQGKTVSNDLIRIPNGEKPADIQWHRNFNVGTRYQVDPKAVDAANNPTCAAKPQVQMTGANVFKAEVLFYQDGDTIYSYDAAHSYTKTKHVDTSDGGADIYLQNDELSDPCPTVIVHGAPGIPEPHQDYGTDWFIFPMSTKDEHDGVALSEKYGRLGFPNANDNCRVDEGILKRLRYGGTTGADGGVDGDLKVYNGFTIMFGDDAYKINAGVGTKDANGPPAGTTPPGASGDNANGPVKKTVCDQSFGKVGFVSLKWFLCPVVDFILSTVQTLEDFLVTQLNVAVDPPLASNGYYHKIWASLRTIALAIIVIVALVMVTFEAAGIEAFSAYTMRSLLARFGVAVLMIVLSWSVLREVTQVVNWITEGARTLIYAPFTDASLGGKGLETGSAYILAALGGVAMIALGPWGLLSFALTAVLSIGLTLLVLVLVHAMVYILIMFSPVAIALSVLPNTRKGYEFWKNALISLYIGLIAVAFAMPAIDVIAESTYNLKDGSTATIINQIVALLLKFMRVFLVLFIFSRVGGVLGTLTGMVNDRSRGAFDRLKNFRGNTMKSRAAKMATGDLYKGRTPLGKAFNATTRGVTAFAHSDNKRAMVLAGRRNRRAAWASAHEQNDSINAMRYGKTEKAQVAQHNDPLLRAQTYRTEQEARRNMARDWNMSQQQVEAAITSAKTNGGFGYVRQQNAARQLARTGTGYDDLKQVHETVNRVAGNNSDMANALLGGINSDTKGAGRFDLAAGHGYHMRLNEARRNLNPNDARSVANYNRMIQGGYVEAVAGNAAHDMMRSKPRAMDNTMPAFAAAIAQAERTMNSATATAAQRQQAQEDFGRFTQVMESYKQATVYGAAENVRRFEQAGYAPTQQQRADAQRMSSQQAANAQVFNPATQQMETVYETDLAGNTMLDRNGRPIPLANPGHRPGVARGRQEQSMPRPYDPNDPRNP